MTLLISNLRFLFCKGMGELACLMQTFSRVSGTSQETKEVSVQTRDEEKKILHFLPFSYFLYYYYGYYFFIDG